MRNDQQLTPLSLVVFALMMLALFGAGWMFSDWIR